MPTDCRAAQHPEPDPAFQALLEALGEAVLILDPAGAILAANEAAAAQLGLPASARAAGRNYFDLLPADLAAARRRRAGECLDSGRPARFEDEAGGRVLAHTFFPLPGDAPEEARLAVASADVTEPRRTEESLRREMQRHIFLMESLPGFVFILARDGAIPYANRAFRRLFGSPRGRLCHEVLRGRSQSCAECPPREVFTDQRPLETEWARDDGRTYQLHCHPMTDVDGSLVVLVMGLDITARKQAEGELRAAHEKLELRVAQRTAELKASEARYAGLIRNLPVISFVMRRDLGLEFISEACRRVLGFAPEAALADPGWFWANIPAEDRGPVREVFTACFEACKLPFSIEFRFIHREGYPVHLLARSMPMPETASACSLTRVEGIIMDMTERNLLDRLLLQQERQNLLGALAAEIAHEFRNPLMGLAGFARRLQDKRPELAETGIILEEAARLEGLLHRITVSLTPVAAKAEPCDLNAILTFCAKLLAANLAKRGLACRLRLEPGLPAIASDPDVLTQAFIGLLTNAAAAAAPGSGLEARTARSGEALTVAIRIDRPAVAVSHPERLFLPLEADAQGFNLAASHRLLRSVGGLLSFEQANGAATLTATLLRPGLEPDTARQSG